MRRRYLVLAAILAFGLLLIAGVGLLGCGTGVKGDAAETQSTTSDTQSTIMDTPTSNVLVSSESRAQPTAQARADIPSLVAGSTALALDLFKAERATADHTGKNLVFSPYSLSLALAMTYAGARSETESQMAGALHFALPQERLHPAFNALDQTVADSRPNTKIAVANSLWPFGAVSGRVIPSYLDLVAQDYGAPVIRPPDDTEQARQAINGWASDATGGRVQEVLPPGSLPQEWTAMVLVDAMTFSGLWTFAFPPTNTECGLFHLVDGGTVQARLMHHAMDFGYAEDDSWQALELPYGSKGSLAWGDCSMVCLLPKGASLDKALSGLTAENLRSLLESLDSGHEAAVTMPRFQFASSFRVKEACKTLGMTDAFDSDKADFSGMYSGGAPSGIWIDDVYQAATISVDENGTEAAAGSAVVQVAGTAETKVVLDRPFLFLIRHRPTGAILFMGQVADPSKTGA